jgi:hypothetical protein
MTNHTMPSEVLAEGSGDQMLTCRDCGTVFPYTQAEQAYHAEQGWANTPTRCPPCRELAKRKNLVSEIVKVVGRRIDPQLINLPQLIALKGRPHVIARIEQFRKERVTTDDAAAADASPAKSAYESFFTLVREALTPEEQEQVFLNPDLAGHVLPPKPAPRNRTHPDRLEAAQALAQQLGEDNPMALQQLGRLLRILAHEQIQALLAQTEQVESAGGMWLEKQQRRRTRGGVFFVLAREVLTPEQRDQVFLPKPGGKFSEKKQHRQDAPPKQATMLREDGPPPALTDMPSSASDALSSPAKGVATVKVTLIGRPDRVFEKAGYVLTSLTSKPAPALPKGLPIPPTVPTLYTVYIALKQWKGVEAALNDPDDMLIAEGFPAYDPELEGMAVFVTSVTTKKLQAAKRQQQATP